MALFDYETKEKPKRTFSGQSVFASEFKKDEMSKKYRDAGRAIVQKRLEGYRRPDIYTQGMTDDDFVAIGKKDAKEKEPGVIKAGVAAVARGIPALGELAGHAIKTLDPEGGIDVVEKVGQKIIDVSEGMRDVGIMKPAVPGVEEEGFVRRGIMGGLESTIPSLAPLGVGVGAGALAGSVFGPPGTVIGGLVGGIGATLGIHGLGVYGQKKEEYVQQGIDEKTAHGAAIKQGIIEGGIETVSNLIGMVTFGWGKLAAQPLKTTAKELLKTPVKTFAKNLTKNALLNEVPTEMIQGALGAKVDEEIGLLPEGAWQEAAVESIIPALTMSVLFGVGAQGITSLQRNSVKNQLNSENPEERKKASEYIAKNIDDKELRQSWADMVEPLIDSGAPIDINADFTQTTSEETGIFRDAVESGQLAEDIKSGEVTIDDMAPVIEKIATQDPALATQITEMFAAEEVEPVGKPISAARDTLLDAGEKGITAKELLTGKALTTEERIKEAAGVFEEAPRRPAEVFEEKITEEKRIKAKAEIEPDINKFLIQGYKPEKIAIPVEVDKEGKGLKTTPDQKRLLKGMTVEEAQTAATQWNDLIEPGMRDVERKARRTEAETLVKERPDLFNLVHGRLTVEPVEIKKPAVEVKPKEEPAKVERRKDIARRKLISEMSQEELRAELLISPVTRIPNKRAYQEAEAVDLEKGTTKPKAYIDVDSLKYVNDFAGHAAGDELLQAVAKAASEVTPDSYHISGDEFIIRAKTEKEAEALADKLNEKLSGAELEFTNDKGEKYTYKGLGVSYGVHREETEADRLLREHKKEREAEGLRARRGERPPGLREVDTGEGRRREGEIAGKPEKITRQKQLEDKIEKEPVVEKKKPAPKPKKEPKVEAPTEKEPWETTKDEWRTKQAEIDADQFYEPKPKKQETQVKRAKFIRAQKIDLLEKHKESVEKAFKAGKTIPPEVLKDYPDLVEKPIKPKPKKVEKEKIEVAPTPEGKEITVDLTKKEEAAVTLKQQKEYLLSEIDTAIEEGLKEAEFGETIKEARALYKARLVNPLARVETVFKFEVPDDGTFEIIGSELFDFQKRVESAFPSTIISKKFKPKSPAKKGVPAAKYKKILDVAPEKLKPKDIDRIFEEVADTEIKDLAGVVLLNPFQNWLLSQDISKAVRDKIKSVADKDYIAEAFERMEAQDIEYARVMVQHTQDKMEELQSYYDEYKTGKTTLKEIAEETGIKRSGDQIEQDLQDVVSANEEAIGHFEKLTDIKPLFLIRKPYPLVSEASVASELQGRINKITARWKNAPIVEVIQSQSELPKEILKYSEGQIVDGVYFRGKVYIVADNQASPEGAGKTLLHESFGHFGLRSVLGKEFGDIMDKVYSAKEPAIQTIADNYGFDTGTYKGRALAAEEWLSREAVTNPESNWVNKVVAVIRKFIRKIMPSLKMADAEIRQLIHDARSYVEIGKLSKEITKAPEPLFAKEKPPADYKELLKKYKTPVKAYPEKAGQPSFQETLEPVSGQDYIDNRKSRRNVKASTVTGIKRVRAEMAEGIDKFLGSISTRLGNVSPKLKAKLRRLDFDTSTKHATDVKAVEPLLRKAKKMTKDDFADWDYARKNSDIAKIYELVNKYDMQKEYEEYRKTLNGVKREALDVGLDIGEIQEYAPRILKDSKGFLTAIGKAEEWPVYSRKIKERADEMGIKVSEMPVDMRASIISDMILGGYSGLGGVPATKQRKLKKIPAYLNQYYMDSDAALMQHLYGMRKLIEARKFFGKIPEKVAEIRKQLYAAQVKVREINNLLKDETLPKEESEKLKKRLNKNIGFTKEYTAYLTRYALQRDYTENIGAYVDELRANKEIDPQHERIVNEILTARFHEEGTRGLIQAYKNISYIDTMGSPISALTQIGDMAWAMYEGGVIRTLKHAYKSVTKQKRITKEDVGVERIAQEFADPGTLGNAVSKVFKMVGLEKIDTIGKETLLNTALEKYQKRAKTEPSKLKREIRPIFEGETDSVIEDLVNNEISDNVKLLAYNRLLDFQPVALSEMPQKYLDAGNGRLFYMLKTFTLKVFDVFRNEAYNKIKTGDKIEKIQGFKNLVKLSVFFVLANAGADELKDFVLGRKTDFEDRVVDNILRLFGVSKYLTWRARTEGLPSALARQILPPFKFLDAAYKDIITAGDEKGVEMLGSVPIAGKLAYWHIGRGASKREDLWNRRLRKYKAKLNDISDKLDKSKDKTAFRQKHIKELRELRAVNQFQERINLHRKRINMIKSLPEFPERKKEIQRIEKVRTEMIKKYLADK